MKTLHEALYAIRFPAPGWYRGDRSRRNHYYPEAFQGEPFTARAGWRDRNAEVTQENFESISFTRTIRPPTLCRRALGASYFYKRDTWGGDCIACTRALERRNAQ